MIEITVNERIKLLRTQILKNEKGKKYSLRNFAEKMGVSYGVITNIENNLVEAKYHMIKLICQTFNVNEEWLRNGTEPIFKEDNKEIDPLNSLAIKYKLNKEETILLKKFAELNGNTRQSILSFMIDFVNDINSQNNNIAQIPKYTLNNTAEEELSITTENNMIDLQDIKIYDTPVSAGKSSFMNDYEPFDIIKVNLKTCPQARRCDFALKVRGDSMEPYYYDGDIVFVKEQPSLDNGQIGIFIYEDEAYIKKYSVQEDGVYLVSLNEKYPPIKIDENNTFKICGLVLR